MSLSITCDSCSRDADKIHYCHDCFKGKIDRIDELETEIIDLKTKIKELENGRS